MYAPLGLSVVHLSCFCGISIRLLDLSPVVPSACPIRVVFALVSDGRFSNLTPKLLGRLGVHCMWYVSVAFSENERMPF